MLDSICEDFYLRCTGCEACVRACPIECIAMSANEDGFLYPDIDQTRCVACAACRNACPNNKNEAPLTQKRGWAYQESDDGALLSSSGGAFHSLGMIAIENGGVVYGFAFSGSDLKMLRADSQEKLSGLRGSKYVQGSIGEIYQCLEGDIRSGAQVVVCGTACQIEGILSSIGNSCPENLLLVDLVCHGVPSPELYKSHVRYLEHLYGDVLKGIDFRDKTDTHWLMSTHFRYHFIEHADIDGSWKKDSYYSSYLKSIAMRECCYRCPYASLNRRSDITLGDFWGIKRGNCRMNLRYGVSALIAHTKKGAAAVLQLKDFGTLADVDLRDIVAGNPNLRKATERPEERDMFYANIRRLGYETWARQHVTAKDKWFAWLAEMTPIWSVEKLVDLKRAVGRGC